MYNCFYVRDIYSNFCGNYSSLPKPTSALVSIHIGRYVRQYFLDNIHYLV